MINYHKGVFSMVNKIFYVIPDVDWIMGVPAYYDPYGNCVKVFQSRRGSKSRIWLND